MKQISGYVLVKETNAGVPNLVVTAYNTENSMREILTHYGDTEDSTLERLGQRIGSVLTDQDGKFLFKSEDMESLGRELPPDLLIVIFAPEDILSIDAPYPLPPKERALYISRVPRVDVGAQEAFVIRLLQAQLDRFQISVATSAGESETDSHRLANAIESTWNFRDSLRERLKPRLLEEQEKSEQIKKLAQEKVKNLSAIPVHMRNGILRDNQLFINGKRDLAENLRIKQEEAITNGLKRFQGHEPILRLTLTKDDLKDLGLKVKKGQIIGTVDSAKLTEKVGSLIKGFDLIKLRGLNNPSPEELERKYLLKKPTLVKVRANNRKI